LYECVSFCKFCKTKEKEEKGCEAEKRKEEEQIREETRGQSEEVEKQRQEDGLESPRVSTEGVIRGLSVGLVWSPCLLCLLRSLLVY
jgi:cytochrome c biogenesis protein CcdA